MLPYMKTYAIAIVIAVSNAISELTLNQINFFIPVKQQSGIISFLKSKINELEDFLESLNTLKELTQKSLSKISSFGEILSSTIIYHVLKDSNLDADIADSRDILFTHKVNDREVINNKKSFVNVDLR